MSEPPPRPRWDEAALVGDEPALAGLAPAGHAYRDLYAARRRATPPPRRWGAVAALALLAGPAGVLGALLAALAVGSSVAFALLAVVLVGPITEEFVKIAGPLHLAERRPWLVPAGWVLVALSVVGGLAFAAIENWVYLTVYIEDPTPEIVRWRWIFGPLIHGSASLLAGLGVARAWRAVHDGGRRPSVAPALPWIIAAVALHGSYNLVAVVLEVLDVV